MKLAIYGTGGAGREMHELIVYCAALNKRWTEIVFIDDTKEAGVCYGARMFPFEAFQREFARDEIEAIIAVGEPSARKALYERLKDAGYRLATIVHPTSVVSPSAVLGEGVIIKDSISISSDAVIKDNVCVNGISMIGHGVEIGEHCEISSHVVVAGNTKVGPGVYIGISASIRDHIEIGENGIISMGAVVLRSVRPNMTVIGNPAREIAENKKQKVF